MMEMLLESPPLAFAFIFLARVADVSLGTVRTIAVVRGFKGVSFLVGFLETIIWTVAAASVFQALDRWYLVLGYASGFATGNLAGIWLEGRIALGQVIFQVISARTDLSVADALRAEGHEVTEIKGTGGNGVPVEIAVIVARRADLPSILALVKAADPEASSSFTDLRGMQSARVMTRRRPSSPAWGWGLKK